MPVDSSGRKLDSGVDQNANVQLVYPQQLKTVGGLTSLASFPSNIGIDGQNKDEYILLFIREHKVILVINLVIYLVVFTLPFWIKEISLYMDNSLLNGFFHIEAFFNTKWWLILLIGWTSYILSGIFNIFFKWFYNINILTTERFIDIDFESIFSNHIESTPILEIQDVKDSQVGILQSIFDMGNLTMLTASGGTVFNLSNVPKAYKIRDFIMDVAILVKNLKGKN
ncbi:MAG: hypothetical protein KatS3mg084_0581 [Candidatus Dojkabacteria bacterium]|nr:MAG: hypothetical protein KatS3mg084_0581 [Candidatus Dojkabacteria bacterium]